MKKFIAVLLTLAMILALSACASTPAPTEPDTQKETPAPESTAPETEATEAPAIETMAPVDETEPTAPPAEVEADWLVISQCDEVSPWFGTTPELRTDNPPSGSGYLMSTNVDEQNAAVFACQLTENMNALAYKDGYLHIWVYIESLDYLLGGQIEICTGGNPDVFETSWEVTSYVKQDGWNELYLPIAAAGQGLKPAQLGMINYIRFYALLTGMCDVGMDMLYFCKEAPAVELTGSLTDAGTWRGTGVAPVGDPNEYGERWMRAASQDDNGSIVICADYPQPMDLSEFANGEITLSLYVENAELINGGQIEFTSSGGADQEETSWEIADLALVSGWNKVTLKIADGNKVGGDTNWAAINYIRIYFFTSAQQTVGLGAITIAE